MWFWVDTLWFGTWTLRVKATTDPCFRPYNVFSRTNFIEGPAHIRRNAHLHPHLHAHVHIHRQICTYTYQHMRVCIYIYEYVNVHVYICTYSDVFINLSA